MASLPPQRPQRSSPNRQETSDESNQQLRRNSHEFPSTTSVDSETVLLDGSASDESADFDAPIEAAAPPEQDASPQRPATSQDDSNEPRRCWICFSDETEDQSPKTWRTPCSCALTAHESCLLDWIADIESPNSNQSTAQNAEIKCPQCKSDIYLARPRDRIVELMANLEAAYNNMLLPTVGGSLGYTFLLAASHHGAHAIRTVFGDRDANIILRPQDSADWNWIEQQAAERFPDVFRPLLREWRGIRVEIGLPMIPLALILSRTKHGDFALPFLTVLFFATHPIATQTIRPGYWPPSAALTFVMLPYFRSMYNEAMERLWGEKERAWVKEVRPRLGSGEETDGDQQHHHEHNHDHNDGGIDDVVELELDLRMEQDNDSDEEDQDRADDPPAPANADADQPAPAPAEDVAQAFDAANNDPEQQQPQPDQAQEGQQDQGQQNQQNQPPQRHNFERSFDILKYAYSTADTMFGALWFPSLAALSGEFLKLCLPRSWITSPRREPTGLLQTKWGRSIVAGCMFVVLKDAMRIYCRWRMAVSYRERRVKDYDKVSGTYV